MIQEIKMRKNQIRIALLSCVASCAMLAAAFSVFPALADTDTLPDVEEAKIASTVFTGESFTAPDASITYDGKTEKAEAKLIYPSGKMKGADSCLLDEPGLYTVEYTADFDGFPVQESRTFTAVQHLYESDGEIKPCFGAPSDVPDRSGIIVTLGKGETFRYNRIIDFNELTSADSLIEMYVLPQTLGTADARQIIYTFTDTEDENNVLTITQQAHSTLDDWAVRQTYIRAGATGQPQSGWEWTGGPLHSGDKWGTSVKFSMHGLPETGTYKTQTLNFQMDYENLSLMTNYGTREIVRFDDPEVFDTLWNGFEKGTAYLSITCGQFNSPDMTFVLTNVAGQTISDGDTVMIRDETPPEIFIEETEDEIPPALVGSPYKLYEASALDEIDKNPLLTRRVFVNYGSSSQAEYDILDGAFVPDRAGSYTVEYKAVDYYGNTAVKTMTVIAGEREIPLSVSVLPGENTAVIGEEFTVAGYEVTGAISEYEVEIEASCEVAGESHRYSLTDGKFRPEYAGEYTIRYTVYDYVGSASAEYTLTVKRENVVKILESADLPDYMIVGATYRLPALKGVDYSDGTPRTVSAEIGASGAATLVGNNLSVEKSGEITITYTVRSGDAEDNISYKVPAIDVGYGSSYRMQNYFYGKGVTMSAALGYVQADVAADAEIDFIKELDHNFQAVFSIDPLKKSFGRLRLTVFDAENAGERIELVFFRNATGTAYVSINGGKNMLTEGSWNGDGISWNVSYDSAVRNLKIGSYVNMTLEEGFSFSSGQVRIRFALEEVSGPSALRIERLNNQAFSDASRDVVRPEISLLGVVAAEYSIGDSVKVPAAIATDVLDPAVSFSLSAKAPDGTVLWTDSGRELTLADPSNEYVFTASMYGQYSFELTAKDTSGRREVFRYTVNVTDTTLPNISLKGGIPSTSEVGQRIALPEATITDDSGIPVTYYVYVIRPDGVLLSLFTHATDKDGNWMYNEDGTPILDYYDGFVPESAGIWTVRYYAADGSGNTALLACEITVT